MLQRLYASLVHGPCINCRPHRSRQRVDLSQFSAFQSVAPSEILQRLLSGSAVNINVGVKPFEPLLERALTAQELEKRTAWEEQQRLSKKILGIIEDSVDYEQETGENALNIGFPLLCMPASQEEGLDVGTKVIAPIAFLPVELTLRRGVVPGVSIKPKGQGTDFLIPNPALLAWLEQQTKANTSDLFADPEGMEPYREINEAIAFILKALEVGFPAPQIFPGEQLVPAPHGEDVSKQIFISHSAVLGLFPVSNQNLLRDTKAMIEQGNSLKGPIVQFLKADAMEVTAEPPEPETAVQHSKRVFLEENLTAVADPCQARAVKLARGCPNLVIHGPPGTGKSQTITNIISDHLANGERVLFVCEKRTALDVVKNRLDHLGLGSLCAVVHDPQRDQRDLYMGIREHLETLAEAPRLPDVTRKLTKLNIELQALHDDLLATYEALLGKEKGASFHEMVGEWESIQVEVPGDANELQLESLKIGDLQQFNSTITETLARAYKINFKDNPWCHAVGVDLPTFLSQPLASFESRLKRFLNLAEQADKVALEGLPALSVEPLGAQRQEYMALAENIQRLEAETVPEHRHIWAKASLEKLQHAKNELAGLSSYQPLLSDELDPELRLIAENKTVENVNSALTVLKDYQAISPGWFRIFPTAKVKAAKALLSSYGLQANPADIQKLEAFLNRFKARLVLNYFYSQQVEQSANKAPATDDKLNAIFDSHLKVIEFLLSVDQLKSVPSLFKLQITQSLANRLPLQEARTRCLTMVARCEKLELLEGELTHSKLFRPAWIESTIQKLRRGARLGESVSEMISRIDTLEDAIRLQASLDQMESGLQQPVLKILSLSTPPDASSALLLKFALSNEISARIKNDPQLQAVDAERLDTAFKQYSEKEITKRELTRATILQAWQHKQITRLLSSSGSHLNSSGAKLKQRLFLRGERALKLRQMIAHGSGLEGGDPLFDVCPVWMASPATVAQIFPREAIFDVLIFDEASQCKLEEALPVLLRGKRVVIAGDPKQLPPTRFFESALKETEEEEVETDQELFDRQQRSVEDLLTAALNLDVQQAYLDVHYRSKNPDLIGFSNEHFYGSRLQPVPGHPSNHANLPPIRFHRVNGIYANRANQVEADEVVKIVREYLAAPKPPSIGIACFNLVQRDLILEALADAAGEDPDFAERLDTARQRTGEGSFEGLFVKNLENVQGDERDVMIISTTFAPDEEGNFRRGFGPVGTALGGRRLNVLVTRARSTIHLITSIPRAEYQTLPEITEGSPTGRWYLYAYLKYAESLQEQYLNRQKGEQGKLPDRHDMVISGSAIGSRLARGLAEKCTTKLGLRSDAPWGNEGFEVDVAVGNRDDSKTVSLGVLCDMNRFSRAPDPVEWESFRTAVLEKAGWTFHRIWSPAYFRNPEAQLRTVLQKHQSIVGKPEQKQPVPSTSKKPEPAKPKA